MDHNSSQNELQTVVKMCATEKAKHDQCFHKWLHEKFLKGLAEKDDCEEVWKEYENCINV
jgi:TRIAP1/MDM35 family protein